MSAPPPEIVRAARQAANRVEQMLIDMLQANQTGDVRVDVTLGDLTPVKTIERKGKTIRVGKGQATAIEVAGK